MDDLISRKALFDAMRDNEFQTFCPLDEVDSVIAAAPAIEAEPVKHGEWELIADCANEGVYCSNCHKKVYKTDYANQKLKSKFCPNCGAKMDGGA